MGRGFITLLLGLVGAVAAVGAATPASAATSSGSVVGHIVDSAGHGVPNFSLELVTGRPDPDDDDPLRAYPTKTDASGTFTVENLTPARYSLIDEEPDWFEVDHGWAPVTVSSGATATPTDVALRAATVTGRVVSSADGTPVVGQTVYGTGPTATSDATGAFTIKLYPGKSTIRAASRYWSDAGHTAVYAEGSESDFGTVGLEPAGVVKTALVGKHGRPIGSAYQSAVVDACRVTNGRSSTCPGVETWAQIDSLQLTAGRHSIRYEVRSPVTAAVRSVTRTIDVPAGKDTTVPNVVFSTVDPAERAVVEKGTYKRGHPVAVRVNEGAYVDGASPRLPVTLRVNGHPVAPTSTRWSVGKHGARVLTVTLPARLSRYSSLKARVLVHGKDGYSGQTSATTTLTGSH